MSFSVGEVIATHEAGRHRAFVELPDILHVHYVGDVTLEDFKKLDSLVVEFPRPGNVYVLRNGRRGGQTTLETRAYMARAARIERLRAVVSYGTSFYARTLVDMSNRAIRALRHEGPELAFFETEEEARIWIAKCRNESG